MTATDVGAAACHLRGCSQIAEYFDGRDRPIGKVAMDGIRTQGLDCCPQVADPESPQRIVKSVDRRFAALRAEPQSVLAPGEYATRETPVSVGADLEHRTTPALRPLLSETRYEVERLGRISSLQRREHGSAVKRASGLDQRGKLRPRAVYWKGSEGALEARYHARSGELTGGVQIFSRPGWNREQGSPEPALIDGLMCDTNARATWLDVRPPPALSSRFFLTAAPRAMASANGSTEDLRDMARPAARCLPLMSPLSEFTPLQRSPVGLDPLPPGLHRSDQIEAIVVAPK